MDTEAIKVRIPQLIARKLKITEKQLWKIVELEGMKTEEVDVAELPTRLMKGFRGRKASLINDESYSNFLDKGIILKKDIAEEVFENLLISPDIVFDEIRRFDERYTNGHGLVEMESAVIYKKTNKKGREKFFSKKQVELWKKELGDNLISKVKWGSLLLTEPKNNEGICIDEVIEEFGLENNKKNRKRIVGYHEKGHLYFEDKGTITETLEENKRIFSIEERKTIRPFMEKIYKSFYSADPEYEDMNLVKHRKDLTFLTGRIDLRTNKKEINRFKQKTISQEAFAEYLFGDCMNFFIDKLNENNLAEILEKEAKLYTNEKVQLLNPLKIDGELRYHESDSLDFILALSDSKINNYVRTGIRMKLALELYKLSPTAKGLTIEEIAKELKTTAKKASLLNLGWTDEGFLKEFSRNERITYTEAKIFYDNFFKEKVNGFSDEEVLDMRISEKDLDEFTAKLFPQAKINVIEANEELRKQYTLDGKKGELFSDELFPFQINGNWFNTAIHNQEIVELMNNNQELRKRIEWSQKLKTFYENPQAFSDYVKLDKLKEMLGLKEEDWQRIKPKINTEHPAVKKIEGKEAERKNEKGFMSPAEFDGKYFKDEVKEYIHQKYADKFENNFYQPKDVAELFTGVSSSIDTLIDEIKKIEIDTSRVKTYMLDSENKKGEFYLRQDITELKNEMAKRGELKKLKIALSLSAKIGNARSMASTSYDTIEKAAEKIGISKENMKKYIGAGHLKIGEAGIISILSRLINSAYNLEINDTDIANFCKNDERYTDVKLIQGVLNLDEFIENTLTIKEAKEQISGEGWLADAVFEYCSEKVSQKNQIYLQINKEKRIHQSNINAIERYQLMNLGLDFIRGKIAEELKVEKIGNKYTQLNGITRDTNKQQLTEITSRVDKFIEECYDRTRIREKIRGTFSNDDSLRKAVQETSPGSMVFLKNRYHLSDVDKLATALRNSAARLGVTEQKIIDLTGKNCINLCENGITDTEIRRLRSNSYTTSEIERISKQLSESSELKQQFISYNNERFCPIPELREYVMHNAIRGISEEGLIMLANDENWINYIAQEINGNNNKGVSQRSKVEGISSKVIKYLINELNINVKDGKYTTGDYLDMLNSYMKFLQDNGVHRLVCFQKTWRQNGNSIDPDNSYYTRKEAIEIVGRDDLDKLTAEKGIEYLGKDLPKGDRDHNGIGLYSVREIAEMLKSKGDKRLSLLTDSIEVVIMNKVLPACKLLEINENSESFLRRVGPENFTKMCYSLKIGDNSTDIKDSVCYQRMESAFRTIKNHAL